MLMRLQELCKTCASPVGFYFIIFYFILAQKSGKILAQFLCKSFVVIYCILFYCKRANRLRLAKKKLS